METNGSQRLPPTEKMGPRIRRLRKRLDLTQAQLGDLVGVKELAVGDWERDKHEPKGENLVKLADALGVTPHYVVYGEAGIYREAVEQIAGIVARVRATSADGDGRPGWLPGDHPGSLAGPEEPETKKKKAP